MKKKVIIPWFGLLAAFALAFIFTACDDGTTPKNDPALTGTINLAREGGGTTFRIGDTVTATVNNSKATNFKYQWQKRTGTGAFTNIPDATAATYKIASPVIANDSIKVVVTATGFSQSIESNPVTVGAEIPTVAIKKAGNNVTEAWMDDELKAVTSGITGATPTYQWQKRTGPTGTFTNISSAATDTYVVNAADVAEGDFIKVVVTAAGSSIESSSVAITDPNAVELTGTVVINDADGSPVASAVRDTTVTAAVSDLNQGATAGYQWQRQAGGTGVFVDIPSATSVTYTIATPVVVGDKIKVVVRGGAGFSSSIESTAVPVINPKLTGTVTVARDPAGTIRVDNTVKATVSGSNATVYKYQWQKATTQNGTFTNIGTDSDTYLIASPVVANDYIKVVVTATDFTDSIESTPAQVLGAQYTVTFDANGGSAITAVGNIDAGTSLALKEAGDWKAAYLPTKEGKNFLGWYVSGDADRETKETVTVNSNITLVAKWNSYKVTLDPDGGTITPPFFGDPITFLTVNDGATQGLYNVGFGSWNNTATKESFVFGGWYLDGDADKTPLTSGIVGTRDVTIKAIWLVEVIVTLDPNGGTLSGSTEPTAYIVGFGRNFNSYSYTPTNSATGSDIFYGWYYSTDTTPSVLPRPGTITVTAAVTLKALWGAGTTVTLDPNGGTLATGVVETRRLAPGTTFSTSFTDPTHPDNATGTVFRGWYIGTTYTPGATLYDRIDINSVPVGSTDITLTALWVQGVEVTIELDSGAFSGTVATTYYVAPGTKFRTPSASPTKAGYVYTGWFLNSAFTEQFPGDGHPVTEADLDEGITVYAGWFDEALLTAYSNGTVTYLFAASTGSFRAGYFTNNEIRVITWTPTSVDGKVASIVSGTLTLDGTAYPQVMQKKVPATNAALRGANWIKDGITLNLYDSSSNGSTQVSNASYLNVQLSYVVEGNNLYLLRRVTAPAEGEVVLTIPLVPILDPEDSNVITGYTLTGWTK